MTDSGGASVPGARVQWSVTQGGATLSASMSTTAADGRTNVFLIGGTSVEDIEVLAGLPGGGASVTFSARVTVVLIEMVNTAYVGPFGGPDETVAVGDTVEWRNVDVGIGAHTVTSSAEPAGGSTFDSGTMPVNASFRFVPDAVGTWDYFCEIHGAAAMSGTLTAE